LCEEVSIDLGIEEDDILLRLSVLLGCNFGLELFWELSGLLRSEDWALEESDDKWRWPLEDTLVEWDWSDDDDLEEKEEREEVEVEDLLLEDLDDENDEDDEDDCEDIEFLEDGRFREEFLFLPLLSLGWEVDEVDVLVVLVTLIWLELLLELLLLVVLPVSFIRLRAAFCRFFSISSSCCCSNSFCRSASALASMSWAFRFRSRSYAEPSKSLGIPNAFRILSFSRSLRNVFVLCEECSSGLLRPIG
jgi:hypothetical protein